MIELPEPVQTAVDAANAGDIDAFLATFTPATGLVSEWGRKYLGSEAIRRWSDDEFIGQEVTIDVVFAYTTDENDVVVLAQVGRNGSIAPCTYTFRVEDGALATMDVLA